MTAPRKLRVGLALGSGSARGWSHIGVIRELEAAGIRPDVVCGTSIGALVGAAYVAGDLDRLEEWVQTLTRKDVIAFMDFTLTGGLVRGVRLMDHFRRHFTDRQIEQSATPFAAVATALETGAEIWLRSGSMFEAVRASVAVPGFFAPVVREGMVLVDGGLVNPVPVSVARAMGADIVIAVDLGSDVLGRRLRSDAPSAASHSALGDWIHRMQENLGVHGQPQPCEGPTIPSILDVFTTSIDIMQVRISRSRMAGEPPDLIVAPRLAHLRLLDFQCAGEAIEEGRRAVQRVAHNLAEFNPQAL
jgi:NTE family protein